MKKVYILIAILIIGSLLIAESVKIAYINTERIMTESKETQEAQATFSAEQQAWQTQLQEMESEIERLSSDYEQKKMILTETGKKEAEDKIEELMNNRQNFVQEIYGENGTAVQRNAELLEPIVTKMSSVIENVAIDNNIDIVLDASAGGILYAKPKMDITDLVIEAMDKAIDSDDSNSGNNSGNNTNIPDNK